MHNLDTRARDIVPATSQIGTGAYAGRNIRKGEKFGVITGALSAMPLRRPLSASATLDLDAFDFKALSIQTGSD